MVVILVIVRAMVYRTVTNALDDQWNKDKQEANNDDQIDTIA